MGSDLLSIIKKVSLDLIKNKKAEGIKVVSNNEEAGGQVVFHTHVHILPLKKGDEKFNV